MNQPLTKVRPFNGVRIEVTTSASFEKVLARFRAASGHVSPAEVVGLAGTVGSREAYIQEVERRFVGKSGFMLFAEIDHGAWISLFDVHRRSLRWILGNPLIAITMIKHDISAGLFVPVELLLTEAEVGHGCTVIYLRPSSLLVLNGNAELRAAAEALDAKLEALIVHATEA